MRTGSDADGGSFEPIVEPHGYPAADAATQLARRGKVAARSAAQIAFVGRRTNIYALLHLADTRAEVYPRHAAHA